MRIFVTGRAGQLSRALIARAPSFPGLAVSAVGRPDLDLERPGSAARAIRSAAPDVVVNAAAFTAVDRCEDEAARAYRINADAAGEVALAARDAGARLIHISSDHVFDGASASSWREDAVPNPLNVYGRSKLAGEEQVRAAGPDHLILRTAWLYGPDGDNFLSRILARAADGRTIEMVDDQRGSPTSTLDLADALLGILRRWASGARAGTGETFHLAGSGSASRFDLAAAAMEAAASCGLPAAKVNPVRSSDWPARARRPMNSTLDCSKFQAEFGFLLPQWRQSLKEAVRAIGEKAREQG